VDGAGINLFLTMRALCLSAGPQQEGRCEARMAKHEAELIDLKTVGARRLQLRMPVFDEGALERVDSALEGMSSSFQQWLAEEIDRLQAARLNAQSTAWSLDAISAIASVTHDLKGVAGMYGYPLITQLAASLYRLLDAEDGKVAQATASLVEAHVDAMRVAAREEIRTDENAVGRQVLTALRRNVDALGIAND
jgi:HPt (histidine-containing phosphotransfer) domain-containing protein